MARLRITLLGGFQARLDAGPALRLPTRKAQALVAYLALPLGRAHPRDKLAALLWGGIREESARASLRQALFSIRRALGGAGAVGLRQAADTIALDAEAVDVDVGAFERAVAEGTPEALVHAVELYQGDLLAGMAVAETPFDEWLLSERERLRELALEGLAQLLTHQRQVGAVEAALQTALRLLELDPLQEPVHRTLMRLFAERGRRGRALRQYQHCVALLQRELGVEPEAETKRLYQEILRQRPRGAVDVDQPSAWPVVRAGEPRTTNGVADTELIGRAGEMDQLRAALQAAVAGDGRVVIVVGEAGVGKTRVVAELVAEAAGHGATSLLGRSYESEQILPFGPWIDAMRKARIADDPDLLQRLGAASRSFLARLVPEIGGGASPGVGAIEVRPVFESVTQLIGELSTRHPVLFVLEDLHWADEMSVRLLEFVGRRLAGVRTAIVVTAREDELADVPVLVRALEDLERERVMLRLPLSPLSQAGTLELVRALARTGDKAEVDRLGEHAWAASEGNPFVVIETARAHAEGTPLTQARGLRLPDRVREVVGRRFERLSERAQVVAATAAVIGREFEFALLEQAVGLGEDETATGVEELVRRRVVHGEGERFDFTHDRVREVAYGRILVPRRRLLHRRVAEGIETVYADRLDEHVLALGLHYRDAEVWDRAAHYLRHAGYAARERAANREAAVCFDAALHCLRRLPGSLERSERVIDTLLQQDTALMGLGEFQRSIEGLRQAETLAHGLGDRMRLGRVAGRFAYNLASIGDLDGAIESAEQARAIAVELGDSRSRLSGNVVLARALYARGDYRRAVEVVRENDVLARGSALNRVGRANVSFSRIWGVLALTELGEFAEAIMRGDEALRVSVEEHGRHGEAWAHLGVGRLYLVKGEQARAIEVLERALPLCEIGGDLAVYFSRTSASLGAAYARSGRLEEAVSLLERADQHAGSIGFAYGHALVVTTLAETRLLAGEADTAARTAERALALSRHHGQRGWEAWTLRLQGEIATHRDPPDVPGAQSLFRAAIGLGEECAMRPLLAHCHLGLGKLYRRADKREQAQEHLATATTMYREMGMTYWSEQAAARLG